MRLLKLGPNTTPTSGHIPDKVRAVWAQVLQARARQLEAEGYRKMSKEHRRIAAEFRGS